MGVLRAEKSSTTSSKKFGKNSLEGVRGGNAVGGDGDLCAGGRAPTQEGEWGGGLQRDQTRLAPATFGPVDLVFLIGVFIVSDSINAFEIKGQLACVALIFSRNICQIVEEAEAPLDYKCNLH